MKKTLSLILVFCFLLFPFSIYADNNVAYRILSTDTNFKITAENGSTQYYLCHGTNSTMTEVRTICISRPGFQSAVYGVAKSSGNTMHFGNSTASLNSTVVVDNVTYYYNYFTNSSSGRYNAYVYNYGSIQVDSSKSLQEWAVYYTYGDESLSPVTYGLLNIRFKTDINTHDSGENQDNIMWTSWDSNGNYIGDKKIEIRAVPGHYKSEDKLSLLQLNFINWVRESNLEVQVFKGSVIPEHKTYTWNYIAGLFSSIKTWQGRFWSIFANDSYWYQYGWIYEARILNTDDTPISDWQEIVTGTASSPKDTEIIETSDELTPELYNVIYNINVYNDYQENWQINNTTINMQPDETLENDKPWWVVLLEGILSILDKLLELLMKLFIPENLTLPDFTNQTNQYMNNTGIFGQSIQFINDTHTTFQSIQNADPVISVPAITYDNTTLIPAQSWNLNTLVDDYGLSNLHNLVYLVTDGFVYIGLIILIRRKVIEVLKK